MQDLIKPTTQDVNLSLPQIHAPDVPVIDTPVKHMWSDHQFEILKKYIQGFEATLNADHEVGMMMTNFGQSILMHVTQITYEYPVLMIFKGYVNGREATLIQHINQLNFMLTSVEKKPERPKTKIGFIKLEE